jgi:hypothetical protein
MFKAITPTSMTAASATLMAAGLVAWLGSSVPEAKAAVHVDGGVSRSVSKDVTRSIFKGDRLPMRAMGSACSNGAWPNYDAACQFDDRKPAREARPVLRVIALR